jgi:hypothetical protein
MVGKNEPIMRAACSRLILAPNEYNFASGLRKKRNKIKLLPIINVSNKKKRTFEEKRPKNSKELTSNQEANKKPTK